MNIRLSLTKLAKGFWRWVGLEYYGVLFSYTKNNKNGTYCLKSIPNNYEHHASGSIQAHKLPIKDQLPTHSTIVWL